MQTKSEIAIPFASFSGTGGKDNMEEESDDEVLLIEEHNYLFSVTVLIFRDREATSSPCLFVYIVREIHWFRPVPS